MRRSRAAAQQTKISDADDSRNGADAARAPDNIPSSFSIKRLDAPLRISKATTEHLGFSAPAASFFDFVRNDASATHRLCPKARSMIALCQIAVLVRLGTGIERQPDAECFLPGRAFRPLQFLGDPGCGSLPLRHRFQVTDFA
jgi:hypothetical protein